jgi:hypothetical protein
MREERVIRRGLFARCIEVFAPLALLAVQAFGGPQPWLFEGRLDHVDPALIPSLKSGWVLSGSYAYDAEGMHLDADRAALGEERYSGGVDSGELTIDLYYQLKFWAEQVGGPAGYDFVPPEENRRASVIWFIPFEGEMMDTGWSLKWLQLSVSGKWETGLPDDLSAGLDWDSGAFRLVFSNSKGEQAYALGSITLLGLSGEADLKEGEAWKAALSDLGNLLSERDATIELLRSELDAAQSRVGALQGMLDLMADRRMELEAENQRLSDELLSQPEQYRKWVAEMQAEQALLEQALLDEQAKTTQLAAELNAMTQLAAELSLEVEADDAAVESGPKEGPLSTKTIADLPVGTVRIIESPVKVEQVRIRPLETNVEPVEPVEPENKPGGKRVRRVGPRKFR